MTTTTQQHNHHNNTTITNLIKKLIKKATQCQHLSVVQYNVTHTYFSYTEPNITVDGEIYGHFNTYKIKARITEHDKTRLITIQFKKTRKHEHENPEIQTETPETLENDLNTIIKALDNQIKQKLIRIFDKIHNRPHDYPSRDHYKRVKTLTYIDDKALTTPAPAITIAITRTINNKTINNLKKINIKTLENNNVGSVSVYFEKQYNQPTTHDKLDIIELWYIIEPDLYTQFPTARVEFTTCYDRLGNYTIDHIYFYYHLRDDDIKPYFHEHSLTKTYETLYYKQNLDTAKTIIKEYKEIITPITETINTTITQHTTQYPIHLRIQPQRNRDENKIKGTAEGTLLLRHLANKLNPQIAEIKINKHVYYPTTSYRIKLKIYRRQKQVIMRGILTIKHPLHPNTRITLYLSKHGHVSITGRITKENTKPETINLIKHAINDALKTAETILKHNV